MRILAIDPGPAESGWCVIDAATRRPLQHGKTRNDDFEREVWSNGSVAFHRVVIEMVASYGMAVGADVFETCVWVGRFFERARWRTVEDPELVKRLPVKVHHCKSARAKDSNIRQALVDRFAPGQPNHGKGSKADPGWFYGFRADVWAAYALAVYAADLIEGDR